jgi:enoyl-CoA hydratase
MSEAAVHVELSPYLHEGCELGLVAHVTVDNVRRLNCLNTAQVLRLTEAFHDLARNAELRAVVLTGAGEKAFIGGADLDELGGLCADSGRLFITRLHRACAAIRACPVPVIARINGYTLGAGLEVAAACDMRVAVAGAVLGMPEVKMGLPSVIEAALLPGLVGWGRTREMLLTGENFSAEEGLAMGMVERVVSGADLEQAVGRWLTGICTSAPAAVRAQKALIDRWERVSLQEGIYAGIDALSDAYRTGEPQARIAAFLGPRRAAKRR